MVTTAETEDIVAEEMVELALYHTSLRLTLLREREAQILPHDTAAVAHNLIDEEVQSV